MPDERDIQPHFDQSKQLDEMLGVKIRQRRLEIGMTQSEVALRIGVTFQQVHKMERGTSRIYFSRIVQLAAVLGCTTSFLFEGAVNEHFAPGQRGSGRTVRLAEQVKPARDFIELKAAYVQLRDPSLQHLVLKLTQDLAEMLIERDIQPIAAAPRRLPVNRRYVKRRARK